jgi:hypothetical protein
MMEIGKQKRRKLLQIRRMGRRKREAFKSRQSGHGKRRGRSSRSQM